MKIAIIVNHYWPVPPPAYGGIERIVAMLIEGLLERGHQITLYAHPDSRMPCKLVGYHLEGRFPVLDLIKVNILTSGIALGGYDLVHTFGGMKNIAGLLFFSIPKIISYQLPPTVSQIAKASRLAKKGSLHFTACSQHISRVIESYGRVRTIYNGVSIRKFDFNAKVVKDAPLVFLGRIQYEKGPHIAIEVARKSGRKLIMAGNVNEDEPKHKAFFEEQIKPQIDGHQINYIGPVNDEQKNNLLGGAVAFLMPILWEEPFGIVMAEALACGTPVIGFDKGSVPEIVEHGKNGFVCNSVDDMLEAVNLAESIDRANCRRHAEIKFSNQVIVDAYESMYREVIKER